MGLVFRKWIKTFGGLFRLCVLRNRWYGTVLGLRFIHNLFCTLLSRTADMFLKKKMVYWKFAGSAVLQCNNVNNASSPEHQGRGLFRRCFQQNPSGSGYSGRLLFGERLLFRRRVFHFITEIMCLFVFWIQYLFSFESWNDTEFHLPLSQFLHTTKITEIGVDSNAAHKGEGLQSWGWGSKTSLEKKNRKKSKFRWHNAKRFFRNYNIHPLPLSPII